MEIEDIKIFLSLGEAENIQQVAKKLNFSPSKVSKSLMRVEEELSVLLFDRVGKSIRLNEQGRVFRDEVSKSLNYFEKACSLAARGQRSSKIKMSSSQGVYEQFAEPIVFKILSVYPNIDFNISSSCTSRIENEILSGDCDLAITGQSTSKKVWSKKVGKLELGLFANEDHPLVKLREVSLDQIIESDFVTTHDKYFKYDGQISSDGWRDDLCPRKTRFVSDNLYSMLSLVKKCKVLGFFPVDLARKYQLVQLNTQRVPFETKFDVKVVCRDPKEFGWGALL